MKGRKKVLVVDDNSDAADTLAMLLQTQECDCEVAYSGDQALAMVERERPDLVILDLFMPQMSGYEVARALRRGPDGERIHLVAHTAMSSQIHHEAIVDAGFDDHLIKPASLDDLLALVNEDGAPRARGDPASGNERSSAAR